MYICAKDKPFVFWVNRLHIDKAEAAELQVFYIPVYMSL